MAAPVAVSCAINIDGDRLIVVWDQAVIVTDPSCRPLVRPGDNRRLRGLETEVDSTLDPTDHTTSTRLGAKVYDDQPVKADLCVAMVQSVAGGEDSVADNNKSVTNNSTATRTRLHGFDLLMPDVLEAFGRDVTLIKVTPGSFNAATGVRSESLVEYPLTAYSVPFAQDFDSVSGGGGRRKVSTRFIGKTDGLAEWPEEGDRIADERGFWQVSSSDVTADGEAWEALCSEVSF